MWLLFAVALLAVLRRRLGLSPRSWRLMHSGLVLVIVVGTVIHAVLIEGAMETISKVAICALTITALIKAFIEMRTVKLLKRPGS